MRIGYPCLNRSIGCSTSRTFRLASYSDERLRDTVAANLACLESILAYNVSRGLLFLRITSDLVPFATHPVCTFAWMEHFAETFARLGEFCRDNGFRISMHPDQFVLLNTPDPDILSRSIAELEYQTAVLDMMGLDRAAKVQIHIGGVYGDKVASMERFVEAYRGLIPAIKTRLVIENDERLYSVADCFALQERIGIPVIFDAFHHAILNHGEPVQEIFPRLLACWKRPDGIPMVDYSSQEPGKRTGAHAETIDRQDFQAFLSGTRSWDFDLMLEIKDKERSAEQAIALVRGDPRLITSSAEKRRY